MSDSITLTGQTNGTVNLTGDSGGTLNISKTESVLVFQGASQGQKGDKGDKGDQGDPATNLVTSVAGKQGVVTLDKTDVGLSNVENTSDAAKPISTATQSALDTKATTTALDAHANSTSNPHSVTKAQVGLGNVSNLSPADMPVSTATQTALAGKVDKTGDVMTGSLTATTLTAGTATDVLGTALSVIRNNVEVGRIDNNASGLRVQARSGSLQLRGTGNDGIAIDASGNAVVAGTITGANLSGTNTGDQPLGSRTITGTTNQITVTNGNGVSGNPTISLPQNIHTGASPSFAQLSINSTVGAATLTSQSANTWSSGLNARKRGTTGDANAAVTSGSEIGYHQFAGWDGSTYKRLAYVIVTADGDTTSSTGGGDYKINLRNAAGVEGNRLILTSSAMSMAVNTQPFTNSTYTLGTSSLYWSNTYTDRLYLNSTAYLDGGTAGRIAFTGHLASASNYGSDLGTTGGAFATVRAGVFRADYSVGLALSDASNIQFGTVTGTKIGTATTQKLGFYNATPVVQPSATPANATDLASAIALVNDLKAKLIALGLIS